MDITLIKIYLVIVASLQVNGLIVGTPNVTVPDEYGDEDDLNSFDASLTTGGMDCTFNGVHYDEGVGIYDSDIACRMYVCEYGVMQPFFFKCYMDGKCYEEGQTWTSGCEQYVCRLTSRGFLPQSLGKLCLVDDKCYHKDESWISDCMEYSCKQTDVGFEPTVTHKLCRFERKGKVKCLQHGDIVHDGPCVKRQCKITTTDDEIKAEMVLLQDFGGCNRRGQCFTHGQSYTTNTCITRTCQVNVLVQKAWFEDTKKQCRYNGKCLDLGQTVTNKCAQLTCTKVEKNGKIRYVMKRRRNACKKTTGSY